VRKAGKRAYTHLYKKIAWERLRSVVLSEEPFCRYCKAEGKLMPADVVDHIIPHKGDMALFMDMDNLQAVCKNHHDGLKQRMERGQLIIQYGPDGLPLPPSTLKQRRA
jgi:5-methylcytosine-specific restriction protein A